MLQRCIRCFGGLVHPHKPSEGWKRTDTADASKSPPVDSFNTLRYKKLQNVSPQQLYCLRQLREPEFHRNYPAELGIEKLNQFIRWIGW